MEIVGWYLGRFENGVRHGMGDDFLIVPRDEGDVYKKISRQYNRGHLIRNHTQEESEEFIEDIISHLEYFGFMGIVKTKDDSNNNQLYQNIDLMVPDIQFIEKNESLYDI